MSAGLQGDRLSAATGLNGRLHPLTWPGLAGTLSVDRAWENELRWRGAQVAAGAPKSQRLGRSDWPRTGVGHFQQPTPGQALGWALGLSNR